MLVRRISSMMKAKHIGEGQSPRHCYFWIATLTNNLVIPEYDFDKCRHYKAKELLTDYVKMFSFYPVNLDVLVKVKDVFDEDLKLAVDDKVHSISIDLDNGERLRTHPIWRNDLSFLGSHGVTTKYALFKTTEDGDKGFFIDETGEILTE